MLQGTETPKFEYKRILERCHCFLLEELEAGYFLRNEDIAAIFEDICADVKKQKTRSAKNELILEHLKKQPEETIQLVLEKLEKRNSYIYRQLFPKTEKFQDIGKYNGTDDFLEFKICSPSQNKFSRNRQKEMIHYIFKYTFTYKRSTLHKIVRSYIVKIYRVRNKIQHKIDFTDNTVSKG